MSKTVGRDSVMYYSEKFTKTDMCLLQKYFQIKKLLMQRGRTVFAVGCSLIMVLMFTIIIFHHKDHCIRKLFKYVEIDVKFTEAKARHLSKFVVGLVLKDTDKISVPLLGGAEYCIKITNFMNESALVILPEVGAYARGYDKATGGFLVYFYTQEGLNQPVLSDRSLPKFNAMIEYARYQDNHLEGFNFSYVGLRHYHNGEFTFTPTYIPPNNRIIIVTDYISSYYFEEMVEHFYEKQLPMHIIYIIPLECSRDTAIETDRSPKRETCYLLQHWARLSNRTGRGVASNITLQAMTFLDYISLYKSTNELVDTFYNVWTSTPPWWRIRVLVYSSHALRLAGVTDSYMQSLGIKDYYKVNCLETGEKST